MGEPKTNIKVKLLGRDGNAFAIMGAVIKALKKGGRPELVGEYQEKATSGDYDHLLAVTQEFVEIE